VTRRSITTQGPNARVQAAAIFNRYREVPIPLPLYPLDESIRDNKADRSDLRTDIFYGHVLGFKGPERPGNRNGPPANPRRCSLSTASVTSSE
jgi:hypothetical protein